MTVMLKVDRMQYGIGQGGFHAQQLRLIGLSPGVTVEPYRFVYDCGANTAPLKTKQVKPLHWAIEHFAENNSPTSKNKITVNSRYPMHWMGRRNLRLDRGDTDNFERAQSPGAPAM